MAASSRISKRFIQKSYYSRNYTVTNNRVYRKSFSSLSGKTTRIGCASGFWGDSTVAAPQLIKHGEINFLVLDYLSEITMSLMTAAKQKLPKMGYAPDFIEAVMAPCMKDIKSNGIRVLTNAGGVNPQACAVAVREMAHKLGIEMNVAVILGDDLMPQVSDVKHFGVLDMQTREPFPKSVNSMNAYFGAGALSRALDHGADVVITGRCTDSALVLAPLMHQYQWSPKDFDRLAAGSLAGHLIECGAQVTGGIFTDWDKVDGWDNMGFPIAEVAENGDFVVTKPPGTGGLVTPATASEQLVYEIGDPQNYILPDVVCDFSNVRITQVKDAAGLAVHVTGAKGKAPTNYYKVCATYMDGYRTTAVCPVGGPRAVDKARKTGEAILSRTRGIFKQLGLADFTRTNLQVLGADETYGPHANKELCVRESVVWLAVHHQQKKALELFAREVAPAGTGMAPGLTGIVGGRPRVSPVLRLFSFLYSKEKLTTQIEMNGVCVEEYTTPDLETNSPDDLVYRPVLSEVTPIDLQTGPHSYRLEELAYTRSGDKGNCVNVGVIARHPNLVPYLRRKLTSENVEEYFGHLYEDRSGPISDRIERFELPGINGFNFLLKNALGGGGMASLRSDPQGKAVGQMLLDFVVDGMPELKSI